MLRLCQELDALALAYFSGKRIMRLDGWGDPNIYNRVQA